MMKFLAASAAILSLAVPVVGMPDITSWALVLSGFGGMMFLLSRRPQAVDRIRFA